MLLQWNLIENRYEELSKKLSNDSLDYKERQLFQKEFSKLSLIREKRAEILNFELQISVVQQQLLENNDVEMNYLYEEEIFNLNHDMKQVQDNLEEILYPADPYDNKSVFLEIRAGAGGQESALFASDLMEMYSNYSLSKGWRPVVMSISDTDIGGFREVVLHIQGQDVYGHLKHEAGVHRVQRVPKTETQGRVHTSTVTVVILPELDDIDVTINPSDLRIDVFRASGAGGQHVNTTDSAVRITHIPTNVVVSCQDERSQHKNKAKALKMLQARIIAAHQEKQSAEMSVARKDMIGRGMRAEKVRTYNYPQNRVTDHQINMTLNKLDIVMMGKIDEIIDALIRKEREDRFNQPFLSC